MSRHFFIYANNIFFLEGVRAMVTDFATGEEPFAFSKIESFSHLIDMMRLPVQEGERRWFLCDIESLPDDRIKALDTIKECFCEKNQQLVILLGRNNVSLFFALHTIFPEASWLLKNESLDDLLRFIRNIDSLAEEKIFFSHSLIDYTRETWLARDFNNCISGDDWLLMEEMLKGKSLSLIAAEQHIDIRRLSRCKRELMKKLKAKNNVELFSISKGIIETPCA